MHVVFWCINLQISSYIISSVKLLGYGICMFLLVNAVKTFL